MTGACYDGDVSTIIKPRSRRLYILWPPNIAQTDHQYYCPTYAAIHEARAVISVKNGRPMGSYSTKTYTITVHVRLNEIRLLKVV